MIPADLAFAMLINRTSQYYQANPPQYMTYTERTHVTAAGLGRAQDINRSVAVRVADNFAVMQDLPNGGTRTGQAFPIIAYFDPLSVFQFSYFANLKRVDITLQRGKPLYLATPPPDHERERRRAVQQLLELTLCRRLYRSRNPPPDRSHAARHRYELLSERGRRGCPNTPAVAYRNSRYRRRRRNDLARLPRDRRPLGHHPRNVQRDGACGASHIQSRRRRDVQRHRVPERSTRCTPRRNAAPLTFTACITARVAAERWRGRDSNSRNGAPRCARAPKRNRRRCAPTLMSVPRARVCTHPRRTEDPVADRVFCTSERERFELSERSSRSPAFEAGAFNHSTTSPRRDPDYYGVAGSMPSAARRARKKRCSCADASDCRTPASTSMRWFVARERSRSNAPPSAPPFGSFAA